MVKTITFTLGTMLAVLLGAWYLSTSQVATGAGWLGYQSHLQTATSTTVGPDAVITLFADQTSATCHSRTITTTGSAIMISFDETDGFGSTTISGTVGHWQAGSTTVAYDAGEYGCGRLTAYGYSSTTVTISSF